MVGTLGWVLIFAAMAVWEGLSLSALEAAACQCPLLLSDLPWARDTFKDKATYLPHDAPVATSARRLQEFYKAAPDLPAPATPMSWMDVAAQLSALYGSLLKPRDKSSGAFPR